MKLTVVLPVITDAFTEEVRREAGAWVTPGTEVEVRRIASGTASIESEYDEALAGPGVLDTVREAAEDGADAVFASCFGAPGVQAARRSWTSRWSAASSPPCSPLSHSASAPA
ncbi:hypothetical protein GCM10022384_16850 [Streptomyces marokkonensis]|uniref:Hydantoin racemase n=1 Tax=Streptomyces marokkonensis TaxID=324855 RepID=A0ABP7PHJ4_9ACTN